MIDLLALAAVERETEMSYIRKRARLGRRGRAAEGRLLDPARLLPVLPASIAGGGNGHGNGERPRPRERARPRATAAGDRLDGPRARP